MVGRAGSTSSCWGGGNLLNIAKMVGSAQWPTGLVDMYLKTRLCYVIVHPSGVSQTLLTTLTALYRHPASLPVFLQGSWEGMFHMAPNPATGSVVCQKLFFLTEPRSKVRGYNAEKNKNKKNPTTTVEYGLMWYGAITMCLASEAPAFSFGHDSKHLRSSPT